MPHTPPAAGLARRTVDDLRPEETSGRRALVRVDFNVPLEGEGEARRVTSDVRIRATLPTVTALQAKGATIVLMSHLGRPGGKRVAEMSLAPVARRLEELLERRIAFLSEPLDDRSRKLVESAGSGEVFLLENLRFQPGEENNDPVLAGKLAAYGQLFVQDAFGTCHRAHASTVGVPRLLAPRVAGRLVARELAAFRRLLEDPARPFVAVLGGAKIAGKLETVRGLLGRCDRVALGGGMANTFLAARGIAIGDSLFEADLVNEAGALLEEFGDRVVLPVDAVIARKLEEGAETRVVRTEDGVEGGWKILDVGPATVASIGDLLGAARTAFWNGPLGVFETPPFDAATRAVAERMAKATSRGAYTVVGGGDSIAALDEAGMLDRVSHASTGGGAALELVSGAALPGVEALDPAAGDGRAGTGGER